MFRRTPIENYCLSKQIIFVKERLFSIIISVFVLESSRDLFCCFAYKSLPKRDNYMVT